MKKVGAIISLLCVSIIILTILFFVPFKINYKQTIISESAKYNLDQNLIYSVIKTESGFKENAISSAGAVGLMQILPSTAEWVCKKLGVEYKYENLFIGEKNIQIGCYYLNYLLNLFDFNLDNTICAYNSGQYTVLSWLNSKEYSSDGITLENIPYKETKNYLKKVKFNKFIYSHFIIK